MTMEHIPRSFSVSLHIGHPEMDPAEITKALGLSGNIRTMQAGKQRTTPKGDFLDGTYEASHWSHRFDLGAESELVAILTELTLDLKDHSLFFHKIVEDGGSVELFCGVHADGNWDESFPHSLMSEFASLMIDLRLDVYPTGDKKA